MRRSGNIHYIDVVGVAVVCGVGTAFNVHRLLEQSAWAEPPLVRLARTVDDTPARVSHAQARTRVDARAAPPRRVDMEWPACALHGLGGRAAHRARARRSRTGRPAAPRARLPRVARRRRVRELPAGMQVPVSGALLILSARASTVRPWWWWLASSSWRGGAVVRHSAVTPYVNISSSYIYIYIYTVYILVYSIYIKYIYIYIIPPPPPRLLLATRARSARTRRASLRSRRWRGRSRTRGAPRASGARRG